VAISAVEAISPAIQRTKQLLFHPFRLSTYLKLCLVALLTEGFSSNFRSWSHGHEAHEGPILPSSFNFTSIRIAAVVAMVLLVIVIALAIGYLITRLRFAFFHCLVHNTQQIRPGWNLYRAQAARFFQMNIAVGVFLILLIVVVAIPFVAGFLHLWHRYVKTGQLDWGLTASLILPIIPLILLILLVGFTADIVLRDFMLPHYALDNATAGEAWHAAWQRIRAEKGMFFGYALLRIVLPVVGVVLLFALFLIPAILFVAVFAFMGYGVHTALADATGVAAFLRVSLEVLIGLVAFTLAALFSIAFGGPLSTAIREYALLFYAGRYPTLARVLFPPPAAPPPTTA